MTDLSSKKILLHICCAPCAAYPFKLLTQAGANLFGFWYNPNIHPYLEYKKRLDSVKLFSEKKGLRMIYKNDYDLEGFLRRVVYREADRCQFCYAMRLTEAAKVAKKGKFDYFTTTLLQSNHQEFEALGHIGKQLASEYEVPFLFEDWRNGWKEGLQVSKELGLYRQQYCGCIYSEKDRYYKGERAK